MLGTGIAQLRYATSLLFGVRFAPWSLEKLVDAARKTREEFGSIGNEREVLHGPTLDEQTRRDMQQRRLLSAARRAGRETTYYGHVFRTLGLDPSRLRASDLASLPTTPKSALREDPDAFVRHSQKPVFRTTTTGTTGRPTAVSFSVDELRVYSALGAISLLAQGQVGPEDIVQISTSARATLGNTCFAGACAQAGGHVYLAGLIEPRQALALLAEKRRLPGRKDRTSVMTTYPSYLGRLVEVGLHRGYTPADFGLERVMVGGEIVTTALKTRAERLFGPVQFVEGFGMTEIWPLGGDVCEVGHLHFEPSRGLIEVLDPDSGDAVPPGAVGNLVATPFPPYRQTTPVLRFDTEDMVRQLEPGLSCRWRDLPATSNILGKRRLAIRHRGGWTTQRDVLEALETLDIIPLPARCALRASGPGVMVEVLARETSSAARAVIGDGLQAAGIPVEDLRVVDSGAALRDALPLRADLQELSFPAPEAVTAAVV
jgi:phenylacetate-coenzyme A ligase PaaK-like adenylate-forming protein